MADSDIQHLGGEHGGERGGERGVERGVEPGGETVVIDIDRPI